VSALTNNVRRIRFIEIAPASVSSNGVYVDPWDRPYVIVMDEDLDGDIQFSASIDATTYATTISNETAVVMSWGRNPDEEDKRVMSWLQ
jgi:hypothetical protein